MRASGMCTLLLLCDTIFSNNIFSDTVYNEGFEGVTNADNGRPCNLFSDIYRRGDKLIIIIIIIIK